MAGLLGVGAGCGHLGASRRADRLPPEDRQRILTAADLRAYTVYLWQADGCVGRWLGRVRVVVRDLAETLAPYDVGRLANSLAFNREIPAGMVVNLWGYYLPGELCGTFGDWLRFQRAIAQTPLHYWAGEAEDSPPAGVYGGAVLAAPLAAKLEEAGELAASFARLGDGRDLRTWAGEVLARTPPEVVALEAAAAAPAAPVFDRTAWRKERRR
jgi:hypothetical protein